MVPAEPGDSRGAVPGAQCVLQLLLHKSTALLVLPRPLGLPPNYTYRRYPLRPFNKGPLPLGGPAKAVPKDAKAVVAPRAWGLESASVRVSQHGVGRAPQLHHRVRAGAPRPRHGAQDAGKHQGLGAAGQTWRIKGSCLTSWKGNQECDFDDM